MMRLSGEFGQRKTVMISSVAMMSAITAELPGKSIRIESPRVLDKAPSRRDRDFT
jgi:hypothetical protein